MQLSPALAATLADAVYGIRLRSDVERAMAARMPVMMGQQEGPATKGQSEMLEGFEIDGTATEGRSGVTGHNSRSGFGMVMTGKGRFAGDLAVLCRGTQTSEDWLSNLNAGTDIGPASLPVHAGFHRIYKSMRQDIRAKMKGKNPTNIHVVGHSLGGAIANMFAAEFANEKMGNVNLYTFGAPRAGWGVFSQQMTDMLGPQNIKRVYAMADPVPMVPIYPFRHAPVNPGGLRVPRGGQGLSIDAHLMPNYIPAVRYESWRSLEANSRHVPDMKSVDYWIDAASKASSIPFAGAALWALGKALNGILAAAEMIIGSDVTVGMTMIDKFAYMLERAAMIAKKVGYLLTKFIAAVFKFLGWTYNSAQDLTAGFIRYVLNLLWNAIATMVRKALSMTRSAMS